MTDAHGVARDQLRAFIERIERLEEEKKTIADDIKDVYGEAKGMGFDTVIMKRVISLRKKDEQKRLEEEAVLDTYLHALGMLAQHDLFEETPAATNTAVGSGVGSAAPLRIQPETASETVGGFPVAAAPTSAEETGGYSSKAARVAAENVVDKSVTAGETATNPEMDREEMRGGRAVHSLAAENARKAVPETEDGSVTHAGAGGIPATISEIDPNEDRNEVQSLGGDVGANTGGRDVDSGVERAPGQQQGNILNQAGGLVCNPPAKLRPNCLRPENCAGFGYNHCYSCGKAAKAGEVAA